MVALSVSPSVLYDKKQRQALEIQYFSPSVCSNFRHIVDYSDGKFVYSDANFALLS